MSDLPVFTLEDLERMPRFELPSFDNDVAVSQRTLSGGVLVVIAIAAVMIAGMTIWWAVDPESYVPSAHLVATIAFLSLMALVSLMAAAGASSTGYGAVYGVISVLFVLSLIFVLVVSLVHAAGTGDAGEGGAPVILIGECIALALFGLFWLVQTTQKWNEVDPSLV